MDDVERTALYYIISGNKYLYTKRNCIYDFEKNISKFSGFDSINTDFSTSSKALIRLAMNLFNGYKDNFSDPFNLFGYLDIENYNLAINSVKIRFHYGKEFVK
jgi:hypothetical protein